MIRVVYLAFIDIFVSLSLISGFEWGRACQELKRKDPDTPNIYRVVVIAVCNHLWWQVVQSATHRLSLVIGTMSAPAEVGKFYCA